mgnify:CR=1 FL=1
MMTSVLIREAVHFANENSSKLYVALWTGKRRLMLYGMTVCFINWLTNVILIQLL